MYLQAAALFLANHFKDRLLEESWARFQRALKCWLTTYGVSCVSPSNWFYTFSWDSDIFVLCLMRNGHEGDSDEFLSSASKAGILKIRCSEYSPNMQGESRPVHLFFTRTLVPSLGVRMVE